MSQVTAAMVKELREQTGAGMMDVKNALTEAGGNMEEATIILRKKGLAAAGKKAGRVTSEGIEADLEHELQLIGEHIADRTQFAGKAEIAQLAADRIGSTIGEAGER